MEPTNSLYKIGEEMAVKLAEALQTAEVQDVIKGINDAGDTGTFRIAITSEDVDRAGEVIKMDGWELDRYMQNPIVLWGHDYRTLPVGVTERIVPENGKLIAEGRFAAHALAQDIRRMYDMKIVRAASVGFIPKKYDDYNSTVITNAELLEWSFVAVPCNPYALSTLSAAGIKAEDYIAKGILTAEVEKKGAIEQELNREEMYEMKRENMEDVWEVMYALSTVYFSENTPVESFPALLNESIGILQQIAAGTYEDADDGEEAAATTELSIGGVAVTKQGKQNPLALALAEKAGRMLSAKNVETINSAVAAMQTAGAALEDLLAANDAASSEAGKDAEGSGSVQVDAPAEAITPDQETEAEKAAEAFLEFRKAMQGVATVLSEHLHEAGKTAREIIKK